MAGAVGASSALAPRTMTSVPPEAGYEDAVTDALERFATGELDKVVLARTLEITLDAPLNRPDGMRAANGRLFVGEGGGGRVLALTVTGGTAHVAVIKEGLQRSTAVEPAGDVLWYNELTPGKLSSVPLPR